MSVIPKWLPNMINVEPWNNDIIELLYDLFKTDFILSKPKFRNNEIWIYSEIEDGKEKIFWHLISIKNAESISRTPDVFRAERLPWVRCMIENADKPDILTWDYKERRNRIKTYIWLNDFDFVIILKKYRDGRRRLISAYYLNYTYERGKFYRKYDRRIK